MTNEKYWADRQLREQEAITNKTQREINKQLSKYYANCFKQVLDDFEATYDKLLATAASGKQVTVADLYNLDRYWQMQEKLAKLCQELGENEIALLSKQFENQWNEIYEKTKLPSDVAFTEVSTKNAEHMLNSCWTADGKNFSDRVWNNIQELIVTLNEQLVHCVVTGKTTKDLRKLLTERFNVSRSQANRLIRTETCRIQTDSAAQRYEDAGLTKYRILGREETDGCSKECHAMDGKVFYLKDKVIGKTAPPFHPNCRCRITPVVDDDILSEIAKRREEKK